jgi:hypothetical protein
MQCFLIHYIRTHIWACSGSLKLATDIEFSHILFMRTRQTLMAFVTQKCPLPSYRPREHDHVALTAYCLWSRV